MNSIDLDDFSGEFCSKGPFPFLANSLALISHLDKIEKNITSSITSTASTRPAKKQKAKNKYVTKLRLVNSYKILVKSKVKELITTTMEVKPTVKPYSNYLEPIDFQEKIFKEQLRNHEKLEVIKKLLENQQLIVQKKENISPSTVSTPLELYFTHKIKSNQSVRMNQFQKVNLDQQKEINKKLIEHLKAKQAETLNEWSTLQEKHKKQEQWFKSLLEQLETRTTTRIPVTTVRTTSKKAKLLAWEPKSINLATKTTNSITTTTMRHNQNKCLNRKNGIYRDEFNCSTFFICEELPHGSSRMHKFTCPDGLIFNMEMCICVSHLKKIKFKIQYLKLV